MKDKTLHEYTNWETGTLVTLEENEEGYILTLTDMNTHENQKSYYPTFDESMRSFKNIVRLQMY